MTDPERITPAFSLRTAIPTSKIVEMRKLIREERPPHIGLPGWSLTIGGSVEVAISQVNPKEGIIFSVTDLDAGAGAVAYTPPAAGLVERGELDQFPTETLKVVHAFTTNYNVPTEIIEQIQHNIRTQSEKNPLPEWTVPGRLLTAGIQQTKPNGGLFVSVIKTGERKGDIVFTPLAAPIVDQFLGNRGK